MEDWNNVKVFWGYLEFYPEEDEPDYDGIHDGGIKGISEDAPKAVKEAYDEYVKRLRKAKEQNTKI